MKIWLQVSLSAEEFSSGERGFHLKLRRSLIMCILCVVQKWSRRAIGMLPWLVIPFIVLWALSQFFPPELRFEITSPRLACVIVLLGTIFWYEILLPHLSVYRAKRCARIREQQLNYAIELQKLRKTATRKCRNCQTPYRDQKPGGGKFMCSYCGHVSRRPILDIPGPPGRSGIINNLVRKISCFFNLGCPAWDEHTSHHWSNTTRERTSEDETCSQSAISIWKVFFSVFSLLMKFSRKDNDDALVRENEGSSKEGEHVSQESKGEKARRKAEEKRQARLEREMLEEEERKQREEVARLIEERRKLRDTQLEADKESPRDLALDESRERRKEESEKRRRERKKDRDRNSSKSNSDIEDQDYKGKKEAEKKREMDRKNDQDSKSAIKTKMDQTKGTSLFSSRSSNGWTFFGKNSQPATILATKSNKPVFIQRREISSVGLLSCKPLPNEKSPSDASSPSAVPGVNQTNAPKKAWHQLFARPASHSQLPVEEIAKKPEPKISDLDTQALSNHSLVSKMPPPLPVAAEEAEFFQDPCFVPDPSSLIGPVSESLDEFFSDSGFDSGIRKRAFDPSEIKKPSPIESPMSKLNCPGSCSPKSRDPGVLTESQCNDVAEHGTWQMWSSSLCKNGLDLVGGPASWLSTLKPSRISDEIITNKGSVGKGLNDGILHSSPWDPNTGLHSFPQVKVPLEPLQEHYYSEDWSLPVKTGQFVRPTRQGSGKGQGGSYGEES